MVEEEKKRPELIKDFKCARCKHYVTLEGNDNLENLWYKYCELYLFPNDCDDWFEEVSG